MLTENEMLQSMRFRSEVSLQITLDRTIISRTIRQIWRKWLLRTEKSRYRM